MKNDDHIVIDGKKDTADNVCEECRKEDESVNQNLKKLTTFGQRMAPVDFPCRSNHK